MTGRYAQREFRTFKYARVGKVRAMSLETSFIRRQERRDASKNEVKSRKLTTENHNVLEPGILYALRNTLESFAYRETKGSGETYPFVVSVLFIITSFPHPILLISNYFPY